MSNTKVRPNILRLEKPAWMMFVRADLILVQSLSEETLKKHQELHFKNVCLYDV